MGNALQACCASDSFPPESRGRNNEGEDRGRNNEGMDRKNGLNGDHALPDDWTDTSMDQTGGDSSMADDGLARTGPRGPSFRSMTKQDYLLLYDGIHSLLKERKIGKEQENELYERIGQQDKRMATAYCKFRDTGQVEALLEPLRSRPTSLTR